MIWTLAEGTGAVEVLVEAEVPEDIILAPDPGRLLAPVPAHVLGLLILDLLGSVLFFICLSPEIYVRSSKSWKTDLENVISG